MLFCNCSESLSSLKETEIKTIIKNTKEDQSGFIVKESYQPKQKKILEEEIPFILENETIESYLYYEKKGNNKVTGATILESIWTKKEHYLTEKIQVPIVFQIIKMKGKQWLIICNLNGNVGQKDLKEVVEALNTHYGRKNVVQGKTIVEIFPKTSKLKELQSIILEEGKKIEMELKIHQGTLEDLFTEEQIEKTKGEKEEEEEAVVEEVNLVDFNDLTYAEFLNKVELTELRKIHKAIGKQLDQRKGLYDFIRNVK